MFGQILRSWDPGKKGNKASRALKVRPEILWGFRTCNGRYNHSLDTLHFLQQILEQFWNMSCLFWLPEKVRYTDDTQVPSLFGYPATWLPQAGRLKSGLSFVEYVCVYCDYWTDNETQLKFGVKARRCKSICRSHASNRRYKMLIDAKHLLVKVYIVSCKFVQLAVKPHESVGCKLWGVERGLHGQTWELGPLEVFSGKPIQKSYCIYLHWFWQRINNLESRQLEFTSHCQMSIYRNILLGVLIGKKWPSLLEVKPILPSSRVPFIQP